jgi:alpha-ribazole phosphatase
MTQYLYLIRHTTPDIDKGICYGSTDINVAESFENELDTVQEKLQSVKFSHFYSSPLLRCSRLAQKLYNGTIVYDERLKELNFGTMEMKAYDQMDKQWLDKWMGDFVNVCCPQGESFLQLQKRVVDFYEEILKKEEPVIGIATHGGVIRSLICHALGIPLANAFKIVFDWGGITRISIKNNLVKVDYINR